MEKKVLNIAVIGCSGMASSHMRGVVNKEGAKLYALSGAYALHMAAGHTTAADNGNIHNFLIHTASIPFRVVI